MISLLLSFIFVILVYPNKLVNSYTTPLDEIALFDSGKSSSHSIPLYKVSFKIIPS